ncbi:MAG: hypothetical protein ACR2M1_03620 [Gemmatimonadaceae bacterium]
MPHYRLLDAFRASFEGKRYLHRNQTIGNAIASHLYDDILALNRSAKFVARTTAGLDAVNVANHIAGRKGRRGDGTFGEVVPGEAISYEAGFVVPRAAIATLEIGTEVKIVAKAMIKQIDRVMSDINGQALTFRNQTRDAISVGIVGVNFSDVYTSYEGERSYPAGPPPSREAPRAVERIEQIVRPNFDELLILRFRATNTDPYPFQWVDEQATRQQYSAAILRISKLFEQRF